MSKLIPPPPDRPDPMECCGSGCVPCIFDYYEQRVYQWEQDTGIKLENYQASLAANADSQSPQPQKP